MFYEPEADSNLMVECINILQLTPNSALDVGVGSGILAQAICEKWSECSVIGIDINDAALTHSNETVKGKFEARKSDLFENVSEKFDLIVCNPPYLPQTKLDEMDDLLTRALVSGPKGYEYIERFLSEAHMHLNKDGKILLLFSNLSNKEHIDFMLLSSVYVFKELVKKNVGMMEDLYVYELSLPSIYFELEEPVFLSRGRRGMIMKGKLDGKDVCAKVPLDEKMRFAMIHKEAKFLQKANELGIGPTYLSHDDECVVMEFIKGQTWKHWFKSASKEDIVVVLDKVMGQCAALDAAGISKMEMTNPVKHMLIDESLDVTLVDFERAILTEKPKNVAQFEQFVKKQ